MSPAERALFERIQRQAERLAPEARRRLLAAFDLIRNAMPEAELLRALRTGSLDRMLTEALSDQTLDNAFSALRGTIDREALRAGESWHRVLPPRIRARASFDYLNPRVITAVRNLDTRTIDALKVEVRESVRQAAIEGIEAGVNPRVVANRIHGAVGLAPSQEQAVANFRRQLLEGDRAALRRVLGRGVIRTPDGTEIVRSGHAGGRGLTARDLALLERKLGEKPLTPAEVNRHVENYRKRLLALNTEAHTKSIALDAQRTAQRASWQSAIDRGIVDASRLVRTWVTVGDSRVRPEHRALNGATATWDGVYPSGQREVGQDDYSCRCIERVTLLPARRMAA